MMENYICPMTIITNWKLNKRLEYVEDIILQWMKMTLLFTLFLDEDDGKLYLSNDHNNKLEIE